MTGGATELLDVLRRRDRALALFAAGPAGRDELREAMDVSESTTARALDELVDAGLVEPCEEGHRLTLYGRVAYEQFDRTAERLVGVAESAALVSTLPDASVLDPCAFEGATAHEAAAARDRQAALVGSATAVRGCLAPQEPSHLDAYRARALADARFEVVLADALVERLVSEERASLLAALSADGVEARTTTDPLPFTLLLVETGRRPVVALGVHADDGVLRGLVETDGAAARAWARSLFEAEWADATPLRPGR